MQIGDYEQSVHPGHFVPQRAAGRTGRRRLAAFTAPFSTMA